MQTFKHSKSCCPRFNFVALQISRPEIHSIRGYCRKFAYIDERSFATFDESTEWIRRCVQTTRDTSNCLCHCLCALLNNGASRSRIRRGVCRHKATPPWRKKGLIAIQSGLEPLTSVPVESEAKRSVNLLPVDWITSVNTTANREYIRRFHRFLPWKDSFSDKCSDVINMGAWILMQIICYN